MVAREYSHREETIHSLLHGGGVLVFSVLSALLISRAVMLGVVATLSSIFYSISIITTFLASFLFHSSAHGSVAKARLEVLDHSAIYLMILGTYLPITLIVFRDGIANALFLLASLFSLLGIAFSSADLRRFGGVGFALYIGAAGAVILSLIFHVKILSAAGKLLLLGGVICYTGGVFFYKKRGIRYMHAIWHALVLVGSLLHFFAIFRICFY